ncbi:MAG: DUF5652 family protein [Patescibacteria group bacterium]|nr:DUF5652 family protein [Patescibacteria group bacterium]
MLDISINSLFPEFVSSESYKILVFIFVSIWVAVWKGFALWHSARHNQKWWFLVFIISNTLGVLEIIYLFFFQAHNPWKNKIVSKTTTTEFSSSIKKEKRNSKKS